MDYYTSERAAALDLQEWVTKNHKKTTWLEFCRSIRKRYGFSPKKMEKMFMEDWPDVYDKTKDYLHDPTKKKR